MPIKSVYRPWLAEVHCSDRGVILEVIDQIKVRWDGGRASYFKFHERGNVVLELSVELR